MQVTLAWDKKYSLNYPEVIYQNANLLGCATPEMGYWPTGGPGYVAVGNGIILATGPMEQAPRLKGPQTRIVDCQGYTLMPGFVDAHCHFFALANQLCDIDCRPERAASIPELVHILQQESADACSTNWDGRTWIRAFGYDEYYLAEKHHPTRWDLDRVSETHPIRLDHRTQHAMALNSLALRLAHINVETPDPIDGVIQRDEATGEPTGLLFEMGQWVREKVGPTRKDGAVQRAGKTANRLLLSKGITSFQDATPSNDLNRWNAFLALKGSGRLAPKVTMMMGKDHSWLREWCKESGTEETGLHLGAVKVMVTMTTGTLQPSEEELRELVLSYHQDGFQVALHAVEAESVEAAADVLLYVQSILPRPNARHRIEHCSECPPHLVRKLARAHASVVSQPGFIYDVGERYHSLVDKQLRAHLYPFFDLAAAGVPIGAGSDAPVSYPDPLASIYASVTRKSRGGIAVAPAQAISVEASIAMHTLGSAHAAFEDGQEGAIKKGSRADFVLLDQDPTSVEPDLIKTIRPLMTAIGGEVVWQV